MLIKLSAPGLRALSATSQDPFVSRICEVSDDLSADRTREILLLRAQPERLPFGFRAYLMACNPPPAADLPRDVYVLGPAHDYLAEGDVVRLDPIRRSITALYRRTSPSNSLLVTERCDNFCLMCSQPPKDRDDSWIVDDLAKAIPLMSTDTQQLGITGGEPALLGKRLIDLVDLLKRHLPRTAIHVLSNGRQFSTGDFAMDLARVHHPDLMVGIPLYGDLAEDHDYVVQAQGAFDDTVRGILNLKRAGVKVEIRIVIHAETCRRLPHLATFIARNLVFVDHVALMGLEIEGFAKSNLDQLWIDPLDYADELTRAVQILRAAEVDISIYNHQLCVLPQGLQSLARRSISDWKNLYFDECSSCEVRTSCGGFFASAVVRRSRGIVPVVVPERPRSR